MNDARRVAAILMLAVSGAGAAPFPGTPTNWFGWPRWDFQHDGRACIVVAPTGRPCRGRGRSAELAAP